MANLLWFWVIQFDLFVLFKTILCAPYYKSALSQKWPGRKCSLSLSLHPRKRVSSITNDSDMFSILDGEPDIFSG